MSIFGAKCPPPLAKHNNTKLIFFFSIAGKTDVRTANFRTAFRRATRRSIVITCTVVDGVWGSGVCGDVDDVVLWLTMVSKFVGTPVTNVLSRLASTSKINTLSLATCPALSHSLSHTHSLSQNWTANSLASTLSLSFSEPIALILTLLMCKRRFISDLVSLLPWCGSKRALDYPKTWFFNTLYRDIVSDLVTEIF